MYGKKRTKAYCASCGELTIHEYTLFAKGRNIGESPATTGMFNVLFARVDSGVGMGDYRCTHCETYLNAAQCLDHS